MFYLFYALKKLRKAFILLKNNNIYILSNVNVLKAYSKLEILVEV